MSSTSKRLLAAALCVVMMLGLFIPAGAVAEIVEDDTDVQATLSAAGDFLLAAGDLESAYATWEIGSGVTSYTASVIDASGKETKLDNQLIREYPGYMRVDALGLKVGTYKIKVTANTGASMTTGDLTVKAHERTGFAFVGGSASGAYNDDGTLKSNAQVIYVTKGSELEAYQSKGVWSGKDDTQKNKPPRVPTCVRIIGLVELSDTAQFQDWTGGLTIEGVGSDAMLTGGGVFIKGCSNVEVRNLGIKHVPKSGKNDLIAIEQTNDHIWVHNCDYFYGFAGSGDQAKGDGSLDVKESHYCTFSYNHFWDSGKCSLLGMHDDQDYMTYHHNWFDHSDSRHPRIRIAKRVHVYNNYYDGCAKYGVGAAENSGAFVEANYFRNTKYPMLIAMQGSDIVSDPTKGTFSGEPGGIIKAYNNTIIGAKALIPYDATNAPVEFDAYVAKSRDEKVPSSVSAKKGGTTYTNFDTEIDIGVKASQVESPEDARTTVTRWAGRVGGGDLVYEFDDATQDTNYAVIPELTDMLNNYKTKLVSVGGTVTKPVSGGSTPAEHTHVAGTWTIVTAAGCDAKTQELVNGLETKSCTICGEVLESRTLAGAHSNDGQGKCTVCGYATGNGGGPVASGNARTLKASDFKMTAPLTESKKSELTAAELAAVADGYFTMDGSVNKRIPKAGAVGDTVQFFDLSKSGSNGIKFTVSAGGAPATVTASFSSTGDSNTSALILVKEDGTKVKNSGNAEYATQKTTTATSVTFKDLAAGTYIVKGSQDGGAGSDARLYTLSVSESEAPCEHTGTPIHHAAKPATCAEDGNIEYWTCTDTCKKNFSDEAMTKMVDDVTTEATGDHTWGAWVTNADGEKTRTCSVCGEEETEGGTVTPPATPVAVSGVKLNTGAVTLRMDGTKTATLTATVSPSNADDKSVTWGSSNTAVATVANGVVTAVSAGTATITVKTADGNKTATCTVTVKAAAGGSSAGADYTLVIDDVFDAVKANSPEGWTTTNIAGGAAPLTGQGTSGFFAIYPKGGTGTNGSKFDKGKEFTDTYKPTNSLNFQGNASLGETKDSPVNSVMFTTTGAADVKVWWIGGGSGTRKMVILDETGTAVATSAESASDSTAYISTMAVTGAGTYYLGPTGGSNKLCKVVVTVKSGGTAAPADKPVAGVSLDKTTLALATDGTKTGQLTATVAPADADEKTVTWSSSDEAVATVDQTGKVTAVGAGAATITVTTADGGFTKTCAVTVTAPSAPPPSSPSPSASTNPSPSTQPSESTPPSTAPVAVTGVKLNQSAGSVTAGQTLTLTATVSPTNATNKGVYWTSSDTKILTVSDKGVVTGVKAGKANVTVTTLDGGFTATCAVTVEAASSSGGGSSSSGGGGGGGGGSSSGGSSGGGAGGGTTTPTPTTTMPFVDVPANAWYVDSVKKVYDMGLMKGTDATHFAPNDTTTRAMVATVLYRLDGEKVANVASLFGDVASGSWYEKAVKWAAEQGVVKGYSEDVFAPNDNVTREQLVVMLYRYANPTILDKSDALGQFTDAGNISDWAVEAMQWAVKVGVINGKGNDNLDPQGLATRAEICAMLVRFVALDK